MSWEILNGHVLPVRALSLWDRLQVPLYSRGLWMLIIESEPCQIGCAAFSVTRAPPVVLHKPETPTFFQVTQQASVK